METAVLDKKKIALLELKAEKLRREFPKLYTAKFHHLNVHNKPMIFSQRYRFLIGIYKTLEQSQEINIIKSVQSGLSEAMIVAALVDAARGLRILYVMPNIDIRGKFVKDRLDRLLKTVPYYKQLLDNAVGSSTSIGLKHFGAGILNYVGSNSSVEFVSFPADVLTIDEVDKCDQKNLEMAPDRLDGSDYKIIRRIGNPSIENWGIDRYFQDSTQELWMVKCGHCGHWQELNFFENVIKQEGDSIYKVVSGDKSNPKILCVKCWKEIDPYSEENQWVATFKNANSRGMRVSQLFSANVTIKSLVHTFYKAIGNPTKMQLFYNSKLGLPYAGDGSKITLDLLKRAEAKGGYSIHLNEVKSIAKSGRIYIGIDVGKYYNVVARKVLDNGKRQLVFVGKTTSSKTLGDVLTQIGRQAIIVIDKNPETREVERLKTTFSRMFSCEYSLGKTFRDIDKKSKEYKREREVKIDRTTILDEVRASYATGKNINPSNAAQLDNNEQEEYGDFYSQLLAPTRLFDEEKGRNVWRESGPDHYYHAEAYCELAEKLDDRILEYYKTQTMDFLDQTPQEIEARVKRETPIFPKDEEGNVDYEKMKLLSAEQFLSSLTSHSDEIVKGLGRQPKTRSEIDD